VTISNDIFIKDESLISQKGGRLAAAANFFHQTLVKGLKGDKIARLRARLLNSDVTDEALLSATIEHPILVNRPIVCTRKGVRLCRPSQTVLDLLDRLPPGPFHKEDGELLIDQDGHRVA
jgi:arsenate reductase (glutaredoxin)